MISSEPAMALVEETLNALKVDRTRIKMTTT